MMSHAAPRCSTALGVTVGGDAGDRPRQEGSAERGANCGGGPYTAALRWIHTLGTPPAATPGHHTDEVESIAPFVSAMSKSGARSAHSLLNISTRSRPAFFAA